MKAVILAAAGDVSQLVLTEIPQPAPEPDEVLIRMKTTSLNPIETKTRMGNRLTDKLLASPPSILGWDAAGVVAEAGADITAFAKGDRVFGMIGFPGFGRTYAEYVVAKEHDICRIPGNIDFPEAGVTPLAALTAWQALKYSGKVGPGTKVLIHAASGGVGHFGVQIARYLGAEVYATASAVKKEFVEGLGAGYVADYNKIRFEDDIQGMDVVFDLIGGQYIDRSLKTLKKGGVLISIPTKTNAGVVEKAAAAGMTGIRFLINRNKTDLEELAGLLSDGELKPHISKRFSLDEIRAAHTELEKGHITGKIAVIM